MGRIQIPKGLNFDEPLRWYVFASRGDATLFMDGKDRKLYFLDRLENKMASLKDTELSSDRPGRTASMGQSKIRHAFPQRDAVHEEVAKKFARRIASILLHARNERQFSELVLVAEPHFLGVLRNALDPVTRDTVVGEVPREYGHRPSNELRDHVLKALAKAS